jgi:translation initiation factor 5B
LVCGADDNEDVLKEDVMVDLENLLKAITTEDKGVCVQSSTLGSLEALLSFLSDMKIPVAGIAIGPVYRKDVMRASVALEHKKEYACILAFDVVVEKEAQEFADNLGVMIFQADIIYHLFDHFTAYMKVQNCFYWVQGVELSFLLEYRRDPKSRACGSGDLAL